MSKAEILYTTKVVDDSPDLYRSYDEIEIVKYPDGSHQAYGVNDQSRVHLPNFLTAYGVNDAQSKREFDYFQEDADKWRHDRQEDYLQSHGLPTYETVTHKPPTFNDKEPQPEATTPNDLIALVNESVERQLQTLREEFGKERERWSSERQTLIAEREAAEQALIVERADRQAEIDQLKDDHKKDLQVLEEGLRGEIDDLRNQLREANLTPEERRQKEQDQLISELKGVVTPTTINQLRDRARELFRQWTREHGADTTGEGREGMRHQAAQDYLHRLETEDPAARSSLPADAQNKIVRLMEIEDEKRVRATPPAPATPPRRRIFAGRRRQVIEEDFEAPVIVDRRDGVARFLGATAALAATGALIFGILDYGEKTSSDHALRKEVATLQITENRTQNKVKVLKGDMSVLVNEVDTLTTEVSQLTQAEKQANTNLQNALKVLKEIRSAERAESTSSEPGSSSAPPESGPNSVFVNSGNGFTQEIQDSFPGHSGSQYYRAYQAALRRFGRNFLAGVPKYRMRDGNWGLSRTGTAHWAPGVRNFLKNYLS